MLCDRCAEEARREMDMQSVARIARAHIGVSVDVSGTGASHHYRKAYVCGRTAKHCAELASHLVMMAPRYGLLSAWCFCSKIWWDAEGHAFVCETYREGKLLATDKLTSLTYLFPFMDEKERSICNGTI